MVPRKKAEPITVSGQRATVVKDCKVWTGQEFREGSILIENGKIHKIGVIVPTSGSNIVNGKGLLALPGLIDVHVHLRDMEQDYKEDR